MNWPRQNRYRATRARTPPALKLSAKFLSEPPPLSDSCVLSGAPSFTSNVSCVAAKTGDGVVIGAGEAAATPPGEGWAGGGGGGGPAGGGGGAARRWRCGRGGGGARRYRRGCWCRLGRWCRRRRSRGRRRRRGHGRL